MSRAANPGVLPTNLEITTPLRARLTMGSSSSAPLLSRDREGALPFVYLNVL
ncbi:MAG TPA: hypothetical protein VMB03_05275 [Bryobacteraceae bacterium]|nr:hypothetical protein [Bryobacteraceae bacterium]